MLELRKPSANARVFQTLAIAIITFVEEIFLIVECANIKSA